MPREEQLALLLAKVEQLTRANEQLIQSNQEIVRNFSSSQWPAYKLANYLLAEVRESQPELIPLVTPVVLALKPARHSEDFASVYWFGNTYSFTATQIPVIAKLWQAWENGTPDVRQITLLMACGTVNDEAEAEFSRISLRSLFANNPAWGTMIQSIVKGSFRLVERP